MCNMNKNFLKKYFYEDLYLQNPPLTMDKFINQCKEYGFKITKDELEAYEELGIFHPLFRTKNKDLKYFENGCIFYYQFDNHGKDDLIEAFNNEDICVASRGNFQKYDKWLNKNNEEIISNYYSNFQISRIIEIHKTFTLSKNILIKSDNFDKKSFKEFHLNCYKNNLKDFNHYLKFLIELQRFYYPISKHDFKIFKREGDDFYWFEDKKNFKPSKILSKYNYTPESINNLINHNLNKFTSIMGIKKNLNDWIELIRNINIDYKNNLEGRFAYALHYFYIAFMLRYFLRDYNYETGEKLEFDSKSYSYNFIDNKYDSMFYLANKLKLNYQPNVMVFVEGQSEEIILNKLFKFKTGRTTDQLGIKIINFEGVTKLISTSKDAKKLKDCINKIKAESRGKENYLPGELYNEFKDLIKNLEKVDIQFSNWSSYLSRNLSEWYIIPFFLADDEGNILNFLTSDPIIKFKDKKYPIPNEWSFIWGRDNNNLPFKGKDFELSNFTDLEISKVLSKILNKNISSSDILQLRKNNLGINQVQNSKFKKEVKENKVKIVEELFDNLINKYENDKELLNRPIFKVMEMIYELRNLDLNPTNEVNKEKIDEKILNILESNK